MTTMPFRRKRHTRMALLVLAAAGVAGWFSVRTVESGAGVPSGGVTPTSPAPGLANLPEGSPPVKSPGELPVKGTITARLERDLLLAATPGGKNFSGEKLEQLCREPRDPGMGTPAAFRYASEWAQADPEGMYSWFRDQGRLNFALPGQGRFGFTTVLFSAWAKQDPDRALAAALKPGTDRMALTGVMGILGKSDPRKATEFVIEHPERLEGNSGLISGGMNFQENWDFLRSFPAGQGKGKMLANYFSQMSRTHSADEVEIWKSLPQDARRELVEGGFQGSQVPVYSDLDYSKSQKSFDGLEELRREQIAVSRDPGAIRNYLNLSAHIWAETDPSAAIAWARENLTGEAQVTETAKLFRAGAAKEFDATMAVWQSLPDGGLRARAAGQLAAGAPADRKADAEALLSTLSRADQATARQTMAGSGR